MSLKIHSLDFFPQSKINYLIKLQLSYLSQIFENQDTIDIELFSYTISNYVFDFVYREFPVLGCFGFQKITHFAHDEDNDDEDFSINLYRRKETDQQLLDLPTISLIQKIKIGADRQLCPRTQLEKQYKTISDRLVDINNAESKNKNKDTYDLRNLLHLEERFTGLQQQQKSKDENEQQPQTTLTSTSTSTTASPTFENISEQFDLQQFFVTVFDSTCQKKEFKTEEDQFLQTDDLYVFQFTLCADAQEIKNSFIQTKQKYLELRIQNEIGQQEKTEKNNNNNNNNNNNKYEQQQTLMVDKQFDYFTLLSNNSRAFAIKMLKSSDFYPVNHVIFKTMRIAFTDFAFIYLPCNILSSNIFNSVFCSQPRVFRNPKNLSVSGKLVSAEPQIQNEVLIRMIDQPNRDGAYFAEFFKKILIEAKNLIQIKIKMYIDSVKSQRDNVLMSKIYTDFPINQVRIFSTKYDKLSMEYKAPVEFQQRKEYSYLHMNQIQKKSASLFLKLSSKESMHFINILTLVAHMTRDEIKLAYDPTEPENKIIYLVGSNDDKVLIDGVLRTLETMSQVISQM